MQKRAIISVFLFIVSFFSAGNLYASDFDVKNFIFTHIGDSYEWHVTKIGEKEISIPVIVIGEYSDEDEILKGMYNTYSDYVLDPFEISELEMILEKNLYRKNLKQTPSIFRIENMGYP